MKPAIAAAGRILRVVPALVLAMAVAAAAQTSDSDPDAAKEPYVGQPGRDAVWVPTPDVLVQKMLDLARVTPNDVVMDLGSGDGRMVIAAAKRGVRAIGVEFNEKLVRVSRELAAKEGVGKFAEFVQGDMFKADLSQATVLALFLLERNLNDLVPNILQMKPGSRMVLNTFRPTGWLPDVSERLVKDCMTWCTALLYIVPAQVGGAWRLGDRELTLDQDFQLVTGMLRSGATSLLVTGRLEADRIVFSAGGVVYEGRVSNGEMAGEKSGAATGPWRAVKQ
jgi:SAM-dependent methyltransferase